MTSVEVWTVQQVAKFLGISEQAVRKALKDKRLEALSAMILPPGDYRNCNSYFSMT